MKKTVSETPACAGCPLRDKFPENVFVEPRRGTNLRLAIGEAPGAKEAEEGRPFVGGSGRWLQMMYGKAGLRESENSVINVIQCRPQNNIFPTDALARSYISSGEAERAVDHCVKHHVQPFLQSRPWKRIDTFGDKPLKYLLEKGGGVTQWRGTALPVPSLGPALVALPTFHPAYIARDQAMIPIVINDLKKPLTKDPEHYNVYPTLEQLRAFKAKKFAFDIETNRWTQEVLMIGLSAQDFTAIVVPFKEPYITELKRIFAEATEVIGQNCLQFDLPILAKNGVTIRGPEECKVWDIMLMHHLRFPVFPHDLEFIGKQFTNKGAWKADKASFETYCARDVDVTFQCFSSLYALCQQANLLDLYTYVSWPMALICRYMTEQGVHLSTNRIKELREEYTAKMAQLEGKLPQELRTYTVTKRRRVLAPPGTLGKSGKPVKYAFEEYQDPVVPWRSPDVKKKYLYETLALPVQTQFKTKKPTVDKNALDKLYAKYRHIPELGVLKELNHYATLLSNFAGESLERQDVLHPSFNVHGTESGRLSSSGPNIQNQPAGVRFMFVSRYPAGRILSFDFSGIENRIVAYLARDRKRATWLADPKFCLAPGTRVLLADLTWKPIEQLTLNDVVLSVPEEAQEHARKLQRSAIVDLRQLVAPVHKIRTTDGEVVASSNHRWLIAKGRKYTWVRTSDIQPGDRIGYFCEPWTDKSNSYLSGFLDGEGHVHKRTRLLGFSQNPGVVLDGVRERLRADGFDTRTCKGGKGTFEVCWLRGQKHGSLRAIGMYRPARLLSKMQELVVGQSVQSSAGRPTTVLSVESLGEREVWSLETEAKTYIAEGFISHNSEHKYLVSKFYDIPYDQVQKSHDKTSPYDICKHIVHGSDRMMGAKRISEQFDIEFDIAKRVQATWKAEINDTIRWQTRVAQESQRVGWTENAFGRKLWRWETGSGTKFVSFHPQSDAADVIYRAMIGLMWRNINWPEAWAKRVAPISIPLPEGATLFIQVHDELVVDCKPEVVDETKRILRQVMTQPWKELGGTSFPIGEAEGASWGECGD